MKKAIQSRRPLPLLRARVGHRTRCRSRERRRQHGAALYDWSDRRQRQPAHRLEQQRKDPHEGERART